MPQSSPTKNRQSEQLRKTAVSSDETAVFLLNFLEVFLANETQLNGLLLDFLPEVRVSNGNQRLNAVLVGLEIDICHTVFRDNVLGQIAGRRND